MLMNGWSPLNNTKNQPFINIFRRRSVEAPIRDGLGAGGQRPSEKRGFFDYATRSGCGAAGEPMEWWWWSEYSKFIVSIFDDI